MYTNHTSTGAQPPFYWKVPVSEKDYKLENVQRIRKINAQNKQREPMKAAFVPGVTKNPKYQHVTSRVGEFLRGRSNLERGGGGDDGSFRSKLQSSSSANKLSSLGQGRGVVNSGTNGTPWGGGPGIGNHRLSRSSSDLVTINKKKPSMSNSASAGGAATSMSQSQLQLMRGHPSVNVGVDGPGNYIPRAKRKPRGLQPQDESVYNFHCKPQESNYNWRFNDQAVPTYCNIPPGDIPHAEKLAKVKTLHRVEYLPCDGICAEETVEDKKSEGGSGRSSSRTSRGMNTEETRIIDEFRNLDLQQQQQPPQQRLQEHRGHNHVTSGKMTGQQQQPPQRRRFDQNWILENNEEDEEEEEEEEEEVEDFQYPRGNVCNAQNQTTTTTMMNNNIKKGTAPTSSTSTVIKSSRSKEKQNNVATTIGGTDLPHSLGTVPKYLKQRQEEWRVQEDAERRAADIQNSAPPGHILMSDDERVETLNSLKKNYNDLINELNRVPIRIDTMRVREHKIKLEQQLQKLEQAMTVFSRPRVFVKLSS